MNLVKVVITVLAMLVAAVAGAACPCNDSPPMANPGEAQFTCEQQKIFGKCEQGWMQGYCECACGVCEYGASSTESMSMEVETAVPMAEPAPKPKIKAILMPSKTGKPSGTEV